MDCRTFQKSVLRRLMSQFHPLLLGSQTNSDLHCATLFADQIFTFSASYVLKSNNLSQTNTDLRLLQHRLIHEICPEPKRSPSIVQASCRHVWQEPPLCQSTPLAHSNGPLVPSSVVCNASSKDSLRSGKPSITLCRRWL